MYHPAVSRGEDVREGEPAGRARRDFVSPVVRDVAPSGIRKFFDLIARTKGVISLGVGEPDFTTPWHIREACVYSLEQGRTTYTSNAGAPELRRAVARDLRCRHGLEYDPEGEILVTVGVSEGVDLALRAVICPGDEVIVPEPCFVSYKPCVAFAGGRPVAVPLRASEDFKLRVEDLEPNLTPRTKVLMLCYPNNPTGAIMTREDLEPIAELAREHDLLVVSDEIYGELTYGGEHVSIASLPGLKERTILLDGFSKAYAMTGWRLGYAAGPAEVLSAMTKIHQYAIMCAPTMAQMAAVEALEHGEEEKRKMVEHYQRRRRLVLNGFREVGLPCFEPLGAFYIFPSIAPTGLASEEFAQRLLKEEKVAVVPGTAFGESGEGHIRCSYATSVENLTEALARIKRFVGSVVQ